MCCVVFIYAALIYTVKVNGTTGAVELTKSTIKVACTLSEEQTEMLTDKNY